MPAIGLALALIGFAIFWYGPWNKERRYGMTSLLSLRRIVDADPKDQLAWRHLGLRLANQGDGAMAEPALREAFALNPADAEVATGLGEILLATGRIPEAFQVLKAAVEHNPEFALAHMALGRLYMRKASYHHAAEEFQAVVKLDKEFTDAYYQAAVCNLQMQKGADARQAIAEAIRQAPNEAHYLALKSSIDAAVGDTDQGIETARRAAQIAPKNAKVQSNLVNILLAHHRGPEDLAEAEKAIAQLEAIDPDLPLLHYQKGELERRRENWVAAEGHFINAVKASPGLDEIFFSLSQVYRRLGKTALADRALKHFNFRSKLRQEINEVGLALGSNPDEPKLHLKLADLHVRAGNVEEAIATLRNAAQINPSSTEVRKRLAELGGQTSRTSTPHQDPTHAPGREP